MSSDVCKHCTHAACLEVCPTGALIRTEHGTVVVQEDICNGCGYCVPACPFGVIASNESSGHAAKCTLCYDRLKDGETPSCALTAAAREFTQNDLPTGCMISLAGTHVPPALTCLRDTMAGYRRAAQSAMAARIQRGIDEGDVPKDTDVEALAAFYSALSRGMAVQARDGASRERLLEIVEVGMRAWPPAPP